MLAKILIEFLHYITGVHIILCVLFFFFFFRDWLDFIWQSNATNDNKMYVLIPNRAVLAIPTHLEFLFLVSEYVYYILEKMFQFVYLF